MKNFRKPYNNEQSKRYKQGFYKLINPEKYMGHPGMIVYRSKWEAKFMYWADTYQHVKRWHSEWEAIPYQDSKGVYHRYFPDFYIELTNPNDPMALSKYLIEIKPENQINPDFVELNENGKVIRIIPADEYLMMKAKKSKKGKPALKAYESYLYGLSEYQKNLYKWTRARSYCQQKGYTFLIINEEKLKEKNIL